MARKTTGFNVTCPHCDDHGGLALNLNDLDSVTCDSCGEVFSPRGAADMLSERLAKWRAVVAWVALAEIAIKPPAPKTGHDFGPDWRP